MEVDEKPIKKKNGIKNAISIQLQNSLLVNITTIDLSARKLETLDEKVQFPSNLLELNLSDNKFVEVPTTVSGLEKLKMLNLSQNAIKYFDETPKFCHTLEQLDFSKNELLGPPYWIWSEKPKHLKRVNLSYNTNITNSLFGSYLEEFLQCKTLLKEVDLHYCGLRNTTICLLGTLSNAKVINLGNDEFNYHGSNVVSEVPCIGLDQCCDIDRLNLNNTRILNINTSICMFKNLSEIDLGNNKLCSLPNEFCSLSNLETCILSYNNLLYLPDDMCKLSKLKRLCIDSNELCMLPERLLESPILKVLDLYDNHLYDISDDYSHLEELDLAQNYLEEPNDIEYLEKRKKLRMLLNNRSDGRKPEVIHPESEYSRSDTDEYDEEYIQSVLDGTEKQCQEAPEPGDDSCSSPEDWDSDSHWIPHDIKFPTPPQRWISFIKQKMAEGNFCPIDAHVVPISEQVKYEKQIHPQVEVECIGQFDDYSSDDS